MGFRPTRLALTAATVFALAASGASAAGLRVLVLTSGNRTDSNRTARTIDRVVIHVTEGHFVSSVRWLRNPRSRGSAHFVVSKNGQIVQLVSVTDVAWHAGNTWWNRHSIGIEHEGRTATGGFTPAEYRASAQLVAYLAHRYGIPLDRTHVIGHNEVPNPYRPGHYGGADAHQDPGRHWNWAYYMALVRHFERDPVVPRFTRVGTLTPSRPPAVVPGLPRDAPAATNVISGIGAVISGAAREAAKYAPPARPAAPAPARKAAAAAKAPPRAAPTRAATATPTPVQ
jgi:N-acetyl-anhydromuramyl-L-alanine amidase AmpD